MTVVPVGTENALPAFNLFATLSFRVVAFQTSIADQVSGFPAVWALDQLKICQELFAVCVIPKEPGNAQGFRRYR